MNLGRGSEGLHRRGICLTARGMDAISWIKKISLFKFVLIFKETT